MAVVPQLVQRRPVEPVKAEAVLFTEDNADEVAEWMRRYAHWAGPQALAEIAVDRTGDSPRIMVPALFGRYAFAPGWVLYFPGGEFRNESDENFRAFWEPAPPPVDESLCRCLVSQVYGTTDGVGPMEWDEDCKLCGKKLTPEALASVAEDYSEVSR